MGKKSLLPEDSLITKPSFTFKELYMLGFIELKCAHGLIHTDDSMKIAKPKGNSILLNTNIEIEECFKLFNKIDFKLDTDIVFHFDKLVSHYPPSDYDYMVSLILKYFTEEITLDAPLATGASICSSPRVDVFPTPNKVSVKAYEDSSHFIHDTVSIPRERYEELLHLEKEYHILDILGIRIDARGTAYTPRGEFKFDKEAFIDFLYSNFFLKNP